jgi:hypothetical protein
MSEGTCISRVCVTLTVPTSLACCVLCADLEDEFADLGPEAGGGPDSGRAGREGRRNRYEEDDFGGEGR